MVVSYWVSSDKDVHDNWELTEDVGSICLLVNIPLSPRFQDTWDTRGPTRSQHYLGAESLRFPPSPRCWLSHRSLSRQEAHVHLADVRAHVHRERVKLWLWGNKKSFSSVGKWRKKSELRVVTAMWSPAGGLLTVHRSVLHVSLCFLGPQEEAAAVWELTADLTVAAGCFSLLELYCNLTLCKSMNLSFATILWSKIAFVGFG